MISGEWADVRINEEYQGRGQWAAPRSALWRRRERREQHQCGVRGRPPPLHLYFLHQSSALLNVFDSCHSVGGWSSRDQGSRLETCSSTQSWNFAMILSGPAIPDALFLWILPHHISQLKNNNHVNNEMQVVEYHYNGMVWECVNISILDNRGITENKTNMVFCNLAMRQLLPEWHKQ